MTPSAPAESGLARRASAPRWKDPQSGYVRRNISPPNFPSPIRIVEVDFPGGRAACPTKPARATCGVAQQIWVRQGAIEVTVGKVTHGWPRTTASPCSSTRPVTFRNRTRKAAHYIVVLSS